MLYSIYLAQLHKQAKDDNKHHFPGFLMTRHFTAALRASDV